MIEGARPEAVVRTAQHLGRWHNGKGALQRAKHDASRFSMTLSDVRRRLAVGFPGVPFSLFEMTFTSK